MIEKIDGFHIGASVPVDSRFNMTKAEMKDAGITKTSKMPPVYITICKDDGKLYLYNKDNTIDSEIGKFRLYNESKDPTYDPIEQELIF